MLAWKPCAPSQGRAEVRIIFENFPFLYGAQYASSRKLYTFDPTASSACIPTRFDARLFFFIGNSLGSPMTDQVDKALSEKRNQTQPIVNKTNPNDVQPVMQILLVTELSQLALDLAVDVRALLGIGQVLPCSLLACVVCGTLDLTSLLKSI